MPFVSEKEHKNLHHGRSSHHVLARLGAQHIHQLRQSARVTWNGHAYGFARSFDMRVEEGRRRMMILFWQECINCARLICRHEGRAGARGRCHPGVLGAQGRTQRPCERPPSGRSAAPGTFRFCQNVDTPLFIPIETPAKWRGCSRTKVPALASSTAPACAVRQAGNCKCGDQEECRSLS